MIEGVDTSSSILFPIWTNGQRILTTDEDAIIITGRFSKDDQVILTYNYDVENERIRRIRREIRKILES